MSNSSIERIAAHHTVERHDTRRRNSTRDLEEIAADELYLWQSTSADGLTRCCGRVAGRGLDNDGSIEPTLEQLERQRADAGADVQQRTFCNAGARDSRR